MFVLSSLKPTLKFRCETCFNKNLFSYLKMLYVNKTNAIDT